MSINKGKKKLTKPVCKFGVFFTDIAEGDVKLYVDGALDGVVHFFTYGQALGKIDELREKGWLPISPNTDAIEALLRTAEAFHLRMVGRED